MAYQPKPELPDIAFAGGNVLEQGKLLRFTVKDAGALHIASGRIAASDPLVTPDPPAFTRPVPVGTFPVRLAIAQMEGGDERIAYAKVLFSDQAPVRWEMALIGEHDLDEMEADGYFGYGVDAGTGCFMDVEAGKLLDQRMDEEDDYFETIIEGMDATYQHTRSWLDFRPSTDSPLNIVCFSSGWGDGSYPSFFGVDADGKVAALLTDFFVIGAEEEPEEAQPTAPTPAPTRKKWWQFW